MSRVAHQNKVPELNSSTKEIIGLIPAFYLTEVHAQDHGFLFEATHLWQPHS
jgi:hypothetical protein